MKAGSYNKQRRNDTRKEIKKRMKAIKKFGIFILMAAFLIPTFFSSTVFAEEKTGSIEVYFPSEGSLEGSKFGLWQVATIQYDEQGNPYYQKDDAFAALEADWNDFDSDTKTKALTTNVGTFIDKNKIAATQTLTVGSDNKGFFENLVPGIYYGRQTELGPDGLIVTPFLVTIPYNGEYNLTTYGKHVDLYEDKKTTSDDQEKPSTSDDKKTTTTTDTKKTIPQTGMEGWKGWIFAAAGVLLVLLGWVLIRQPKKKA